MALEEHQASALRNVGLNQPSWPWLLLLLGLRVQFRGLLLLLGPGRGSGGFCHCCRASGSHSDGGAEGVPPTADSPLVVEVLVVMDNSIVEECPSALFDPSVDETFVLQLGSESKQLMDDMIFVRKKNKEKKRVIPEEMLIIEMSDFENFTDKEKH